MATLEGGSPWKAQPLEVPRLGLLQQLKQMRDVLVQNRPKFSQPVGDGETAEWDKEFGVWVGGGGGGGGGARRYKGVCGGASCYRCGNVECIQYVTL